MLIFKRIRAFIFKISLKSKRTAGSNLRELGCVLTIVLSYAMTIHKAQGQTFD